MTCVCVWLGVGGGEWVRGLGFTNPGGTWRKWIWLCVLVAVVLGGVGGLLGPGPERVGWCFVCVCCESGLFVLMASPGICILC